jgi:hypothetical protein
VCGSYPAQFLRWTFNLKAVVAAVAAAFGKLEGKGGGKKKSVDSFTIDARNFSNFKGGSPKRSL